MLVLLGYTAVQLDWRGKVQMREMMSAKQHNMRSVPQQAHSISIVATNQQVETILYYWWVIMKGWLSYRTVGKHQPGERAIIKFWYWWDSNPAI
jgi:hypothetical protein